VLLQVLVPDARRSRAPDHTGAPSVRRRCRASSPAHPLRFRARLLLLRTVSDNPR
jgi:hypothetical protein